MEDKKQYEAFMEELKKLANNFRDVVTELGDILAKILPDVEIPDEEEEDTWEMKCPYENNDDIYTLSNDGEVKKNYWSYFDYDRERFEQGNIFPTKEAALLEAKRRNLLTRFRAFRDECNGNWKINWKDVEQAKYIIKSDNEGDLHIVTYWTVNEFHLFGYFKDYRDAQRAIELFSDEIKELFVDCEGE